MLLPVIISGGAGARLWPVSRDALPKPFITLPDGGTLLQKTLQRATALDGVERVLTVTNREYYFLTRDAYEGAGEEVTHDYLLELVARNTAPTIAALNTRPVWGWLRWKDSTARLESFNARFTDIIRRTISGSKSSLPCLGLFNACATNCL